MTFTERQLALLRDGLGCLRHNITMFEFEDLDIERANQRVVEEIDELDRMLR